MVINRWIGIPLIMLLISVLGILSVINLKLGILLVGFLFFLIFTFLFTNELNIKAIVPPFLILILFQDTIIRNINLVSPSIGSAFSYVDELFILLTLPPIIINFFRGKIINGVSVLIALILILILGLLSSFIHNVPTMITLQGALLMIKGLLYLFIFANLSYKDTELKRLIKWVKYGAIAVLICSLADLLFPYQFRAIFNIDHYFDHRVGGLISLISLFIHPGIYGWFMVFIGIYLASKFKVTSNAKYLFLCCLFFGFAFLSFRFKSILAMLVIFLVFYLLMGLRKSMILLFPLSLVLVIAYIAAGGVVVELLDLTISRYLDVDMYDSARKALYMVSFMIAQSEFPFGVGFGRFGGYIAQQHYSPVYYEYGLNTVFGLRPENPLFATDTYWTNILGELGVFGLIILLGLFIYLVIKMLFNYKVLENKTHKLIVLFSGMALIQALVESSGEPVFNSSPQNVFIFVSLGIGLSIIADSKKQKKE